MCRVGSYGTAPVLKTGIPKGYPGSNPGHGVCPRSLMDQNIRLRTGKVGVQIPPGILDQSRIAQLAERMTLNHEAAGSIPAAVVYKGLWCSGSTQDFDS